MKRPPSLRITKLNAGVPRAVLRDQTKAAPWESERRGDRYRRFRGRANATSGVFGRGQCFCHGAVELRAGTLLSRSPGCRGCAEASTGCDSTSKGCRLTYHRRAAWFEPGLITEVRILEDELAKLSLPTAILRPTWFTENSLWDIAPARASGDMASFLQPLNRPFHMIATADIGGVVAATLKESWAGRRVIEIERPKRYTQHEIASLLGQAIGRSVRARATPRDQWEALFRSQGTAWPAPRIEMLEGFNSGLIDFEANAAEYVIGKTPYEAVLMDLVRRGA